MQNNLEQRYAEIEAKVKTYTDFTEDQLNNSRELFTFENGQIIPKRFEVWTTLVGLPVNIDLQNNLVQLINEIKILLPSNIRIYEVKPENYHWELFIIKRPNETVAPEQLQEARQIFTKLLGKVHTFEMLYKGFLITPDGTIIVKGFGNFDELRHELKSHIPFASAKQSNIGHISIGRILDPVGQDVFKQITNKVETSKEQIYGQQIIDEIKYVHETQWYMEEKEIIETYNLL